VTLAVDDLEGALARARAAGLSGEVGDGGWRMGEIVRRSWGEGSFHLEDPFGNPPCFVDAATLFTRRP
jgi:hypothetical protein